ncbi:MAG: hypothetical protein WAK75_06675 [Methanoregula sp.]|uniref:hypothetical protein n=1 Tax=Methanoregula sp. TaxID=2052170 RepID=UPI003BB0D947
MAKKFRRFLWQFVIGFGFLSGLWTAIGINPENVIITALGSVVTTQVSDPVIRAFIVLLPTLILIVSVIGAYRHGKIPGLIAVLVAYVAGLVILSAVLVGLAVLCVAVIIGYYSTGSRRK